MKREHWLPLGAGLAVLIGVLIASHFDLDSRFFQWLQNAAPERQSETAGATTPPDTAMVATTAGLSDTIDYNAAHGIGPDPVMVEGAALGIAAYGRIFGNNPESTFYVRTSTKPLRDGVHAILIVAGTGKTERTYTSEYSTRPQDAQSNLDRLANVIVQFSRDFQNHVSPVDNLRPKLSGPPAPLPPLALPTLSGKWVTELQQLSLTINQGPRLLSGLRRAEEIFAWMSIFKNWHEDQTLSLQLASEAVGYELLARSLEPDRNTPQLAESMMWLATRYERNALQVLESFGRTPDRLIDALISYIRLDVDRLERFARGTGDMGAVAGYLLGRTYGYLRQPSTANLALARTLEETASFQEAAIYQVAIAELGNQRASLRHALQQMMHEHRFLTGRPADSSGDASWIQEMFVDDLTLLNQRIGTLVNEHKAVMTALPVSTGRDRALRGDLLRAYVREDFLNACLVAYRMYEITLAMVDNAEVIAKVVKEAYPSSSLAGMIQLRRLQASGDLHEALRQGQNINMKSAGPLLQRELLRYFGTWDDSKVWPSVMGVLDAYRKRESAGSHGSRILGFYTHYSLHRSQGIELAKRAIELNPYEIYAYRDLSEYQQTADALDSARTHVGHLYQYALLSADWQARHGYAENAARLYQQAISKSPDTYTAYARLARLHRDQRKPQLAIDVLKRYLARGSDTLSTIDARNTIGFIALEKNNLQEAMAIFQKTQHSMHGDSLAGFARTNERLGRIKEARSTFTLAANRYPQFYAPTRLALFELRQGRQEDAVAALRRYSQYNRASYYFDELVSYFERTGKPADAIDIVKAVLGPQPSVNVLYELGGTYHRQKLFREAALVHRDLAQSGEDRFLHAALYYDNAQRAAPSNGPEALKEALAFLGQDPIQRGRFTLALVRLGHYRTAYDTLDSLVPADAEMAAHKALMQALYGRLARLDIATLKASDRSPLSNDPWRRQLFEFLVGETDTANILAAVRNARQFVMAHYYIAILAHLKNNSRDALDHLRTGLAKGPVTQDEFWLAYTLLASIDQKEPGWCCRAESY